MILKRWKTTGSEKQPNLIRNKAEREAKEKGTNV